MLTRMGLVWPIHFLLCDAVTREDHRVSANAFSLTGKIFVTQGRSTDGPAQVLGWNDYPQARI
jgi:hypothetical protein